MPGDAVCLEHGTQCDLCAADLGLDEEVEHNVLEVSCIQPDPAGHDNPHCPVLRHHVPAEGPPSHNRYANSFICNLQNHLNRQLVMF